MHAGKRSLFVKNEETEGASSAIFFLVLVAVAMSFIVWSWRNQDHGTSAVQPVIVAPMVAKPLPIIKVLPDVQLQQQMRVYVLQWGDTLTKLARMSCDTVPEIAKRNSLHVSSVIYAGNSIKLKMVEHCSPESAKAIAFPEKFPSRHKRAGASREKSFHPESGAAHGHQTFAKDHAASVLGCGRVGSRIRGFDSRVLARADCIRATYGAIIREAIEATGAKLSESEIVAVMIHESKGNPRAISSAKHPCFGLMQLQGATAWQYGVKHVFDPRENILGGLYVLSDYTFNYAQGDRDRGLASYNMGPFHRLLRTASFKPSEFRYVRDVRRIQRVLEDEHFTL